MQNLEFNIPILFIIFNRPDETSRVFEMIRSIRPKKLYVVADGPRKNVSEEDVLCKKVKEIISVDWDCQLITNYSDINLGCKKRVSSGIDWFFQNEEMGIILEDDCLPNTSFFFFCQEMLIKYKNDERIGMITGDNFQLGKIKNEYSYYFSKYSHIWGWATWKRAWNKYDVDMKDWNSSKQKLKQIFKNEKLKQIYWSYIFEKVFQKKIDTWDYQWTYTCFLNNYLSITPCVNLISNIGFGGKNATHTKRKNKLSNLERFELIVPLRHPKIITIDSKSDRFTEKITYPFFRFFIGKIIKKFL